MNRASRSFTRSTARVVDARNLTGRYDFCSLDVEGHEGRILRRIDFTRLAIGIFLIESAEFGTRAPTYRDWEDHLLANGYRFLAQFSFLNRFYVHSSYPVTTEIDL